MNDERGHCEYCQLLRIYVAARACGNIVSINPDGVFDEELVNNGYCFIVYIHKEGVTPDGKDWATAFYHMPEKCNCDEHSLAS
jgi:hypothetical protein